MNDLREEYTPFAVKALLLYMSLTLSCQFAEAQAQSTLTKRSDWGCRLNEGQSDLTQKQRQAICAADEHYDIDVLWKEDSAIVLIGETHVKDTAASYLGLQLIKEFDYRSFETANWTFPDEKGYKLRRTLEKWYWYLKGYRERSTISDMTLGFYLSTEMTAETSGITFIDDMDMNVSEIYLGKKNVSHLWFFDSKLCGDTIDLDHMEQIIFGKRHMPKCLIDLNADHHFKKRQPTELDPLVLQTFANKPINIHLEVSEEVIDYVIRQCPSGPYGCPKSITVDARNFAMRERLLESLTFFPDRRVIVAVVGVSHVDGISYGLQCRYGFNGIRATRRSKGPMAKPDKLEFDSTDCSRIDTF